MTEVIDPQRLDAIRRLLVILDGQDPEARQALTDFMSFNNDIERTNLPKRQDVHFVSYLDICSKSYFPDFENNPFAVFAKSIAIAFMAKGGLKSNQFVDLFRNSPDLAALQTVLGVEPQKQSLTDRLFRRGKEE